MAAERGGKKALELVVLKYLEDSLTWKEKKNYYGFSRAELGQWVYVLTHFLFDDFRYIKPSSILIMFAITLGFFLI